MIAFDINWVLSGGEKNMHLFNCVLIVIDVSFYHYYLSIFLLFKCAHECLYAACE